MKIQALEEGGESGVAGIINLLKIVRSFFPDDAKKNDIHGEFI